MLGSPCATLWSDFRGGNGAVGDVWCQWVLEPLGSGPCGLDLFAWRIPWVPQSNWDLGGLEAGLLTFGT